MKIKARLRKIQQLRAVLAEVQNDIQELGGFIVTRWRELNPSADPRLFAGAHINDKNEVVIGIKYIHKNDDGRRGEESWSLSHTEVYPLEAFEDKEQLESLK